MGVDMGMWEIRFYIQAGLQRNSLFGLKLYINMHAGAKITKSDSLASQDVSRDTSYILQLPDEESLSNVWQSPAKHL